MCQDAESKGLHDLVQLSKECLMRMSKKFNIEQLETFPEATLMKMFERHKTCAQFVARLMKIARKPKKYALNKLLTQEIQNDSDLDIEAITMHLSDKYLI